MQQWTAEEIAELAGAKLVLGADENGPEGVTIDSRMVADGKLFFGLRGESGDGGTYAEQTLAAGAWGVLVRPEYVTGLTFERGVVLTSEDPLGSLALLARSWRRSLGCPVVGISGSVGKTSTKDILAALLATQLETHKTPGNWNTEIGLPLTVLSAPTTTEALVLEMAMRGPEQVAELTDIAEPTVGIVLNVGPEHLELLGSLEAVAAAEAELIAELPAGGLAITPTGERLLDPHLSLRDDIRYRTFGDGGDVYLISTQHAELDRDGVQWEQLEVSCMGERLELELPFSQAHQLQNALAAIAAAYELGAIPAGRVPVTLSPLRGQRVRLTSGALAINDTYNANPISVRAALDDLAATARARRVAILGDMLELGPEAERYHAEIGNYAGETGVDILITVGPLAEGMTKTFTNGEAHSVGDASEAVELATELLHADDTVLVKGSRSVGLERVVEALGEGS